MKVILMTSASGGTGLTTSAVRVAESLAERRHASLVVDLSPYQCAALLANEQRVSVVNGRALTTEVAVRARLNPERERIDAVLIDAPRLDDPALEPWLPLCDGLLITVRSEPGAIHALSGIWSAIESAKRANPRMKFLGFLPTMAGETEASVERLLESAARGVPRWRAIPFDPRETRRAQETIISGLAPVPAEWPEASAQAYGEAAGTLARVMQITQRPEEEKKPKGLFTRLWKVATEKTRGIRVQREEVGWKEQPAK